MKEQLKKEIEQLERTIRILRANLTVAIDKKEHLEEELERIENVKNLPKTD